MEYSQSPDENHLHFDVQNFATNGTYDKEGTNRCKVLEALGEVLEALGGVLGASGRSLGRLGQALECLNCVLDASWGRLGGFGRSPEANLRHLGGLWGRLGGVLGPSWSIWGCLGRVFAWRFRVLSRSQAKITN